MLRWTGSCPRQLCRSTSVDHLLLVSQRRHSACCSYTNKDNLKWQQSIIPQQKVIAAPSLALAEYRRAVPSGKIKVSAVCVCVFFFYLILLQETKGSSSVSTSVLTSSKKRRNLYFHCIDSGSPLMPVKPVQAQTPPTPHSSSAPTAYRNVHLGLS